MWGEVRKKIMKPKGKKIFFRSKEINKNIKETACSMKNTELGKE